jgi:putative transposase
MFYGDPAADGVVGTQRKRGTNYAYRFATASVLTEGQRVTVAVVPFTTGPVVDHVRRLVEQVSTLGIRIEYLLLDRGYYSAALIRYLESSGIRYVVHMPAHTRLEAGQDRVYTSRSHRRREDEQATFRLVTMMESGELYAFATNLSLTPKEIRRTFRLRWGIETAYRMIRMFLPRTTSKAYRTRMLYFFMAVLLYNLWVLLNFRKEGHMIVEAVKLDVVLFIMSAVEKCVDGG